MSKEKKEQQKQRDDDGRIAKKGVGATRGGRKKDYLVLTTHQLFTHVIVLQQD